MDTEPEGRGPLAMSKACDSCRARKIKCDRKVPCSSCVASQMQCRTSIRQLEKKKRILISPGYEKEVHSVNERLASLEKTINNLVVATSSRSPANSDDSTQRISAVRASTALEEDSNSPFEGASSFTAHSNQVSNAFRSAVSTVDLPGETLPPSGLGTTRFQHEPKESAGDHYELPPSSLVLKTLKAAKTNPQKYFPGISDLTISSMGEMCQKVYFPTEDCSTAFVTVVMCSLWFLFTNFSPRDLRKHEIDELAFECAKQLCTNNLEEAARCTPLLLGHSYRQIQALLLICLFLIETSRPSLALRFVSASARLCQDAGYHCLTYDSPDPEARHKILTFWFIFSIDRALSLKFGRSSALQEYDITASRPTLEEAKESHDLFFASIGVDMAYLQGDIYEQLYSGRAQSENADVKTHRARALADRMLRLRQDLLAFDVGDSIPINDMKNGFDLVWQCHLALIYRLIPSTRGQSPLHFCDECVAASRAAIEGFNKAWESYQAREDTAWMMAVNWTYLSSPFTPFIVLFGTAVSMESEADLKLMESSVSTMKSASQYSPGVAKLHNACETFYNLAKAYMAQTTKRKEVYQNPLHQQLPMDVFDPASLYGQDWDTMLDDWDLGLSGESAREMSTFLSGNSFSWANLP